MNKVGNGHFIVPGIKEHYKMYKIGRQWVFAGILTAGVGGSLLMTSGMLQVHADTTASTSASSVVTTSVEDQDNSSVASSQKVATSSAPVSSSQASSVASVSSSSAVSAVGLKSSVASESSSSASGVEKSNSSATNAVSGNMDSSSSSSTSVVSSASGKSVLNAVSNGAESAVASSSTKETVSAASSSSSKVQSSARVAAVATPKLKTMTAVAKSASITKSNDAIVKKNGATTTVTPNSDALQSAINNAKANGVVVNVSNTKNNAVSNADVAKTLAQINQAYSNQVAAINATTADYVAKKKAYDTAYSLYKQKLDVYTTKLNASKERGELDAGDVLQHLTIAKEPNSVLTISNVSSKIAETTQRDPKGNASDNTGMDSAYSYALLAGYDTPVINGTVAVATFSNLTHSSYTDENGVKHQLAKIVETFSDFDGYSYTNDDGVWVPALIINNDVSDGFWYQKTNGVTVSYKYYDEKGQEINLADGTAFLNVSSLNARYEDSNGDVAVTGLPSKREAAAGLKNAVAKKLLGSSITVHSGNKMYADQANEGPDTSWTGDTAWDVSGGPNEYYGSGIFQISGNENVIRFSTDRVDKHKQTTVWAITSTNIPASSLLKPTAPKAPTVPDATVDGQLQTITTTTPEDVSKVADNESKVVLAGQTTTQHIKNETGLLTSTGFVLGDYIYYSNGKLPVSINTGDITVTDKNGANVSDQYNIVFNANGTDNTGKQAGVLTATAKNPGALSLGSLYTLNVKQVATIDHQADKEVDKGFGIVNGTFSESTSHSYDEWTPSTSKNWVEGTQVVNGKVAINGDVTTGQITTSLPDPDKLDGKLNKVAITDDYTNFAKLVDFQSAQILENEKDVTSLYTVTNDATGHVYAVRKDATTTPGGAAKMIAKFKIHQGVPSGTVLKNTGSATINSDTVTVPTVSIVTYEPEAHKHWTSLDNQTVTDGKVYVAGDRAAAKVTSDIPGDLIKNLTNFAFGDDYSEKQFKADKSSVKVYLNGNDITNLGSVTDDGSKITFAVTNAANLAKLTAGPLVMTLEGNLLTDLKTGDKIPNTGWVTLNTATTTTETPTISVYTPVTDKNWVEGSQVVNGHFAIDGDVVTSEITSTLPVADQLNTKLSKVVIDDDFTKFANLADYQSAQVLENGKDVTSEYTITHDVAGHVYATRKDASATPSGNVKLVAKFKVHMGVATGTALINSGSVTINSDTVKVPTVSIVTYNPAADKHWTSLDNQTITDGKTYVAGDKAAAEVNSEIPSNLIKNLNKFELGDDYSESQFMADKSTFKVINDGVDITSWGKVTDDGSRIYLTITDSSKLAQLKAGAVQLTFQGTLKKDLKNGTKIPNDGWVTMNNATTVTNTPNIFVFKTETSKNWIEGSQVVNGKVAINDDVATAQVDMTLPDPSKLNKKLSKVQLTDDYSKFAKDVDYQSAKVLENGKDVSSLYTITNDKAGYVYAVRKDAATTPAGTASLVTTFKIHDDVTSGSKLVNAGSGTVNDDTVEVPDVDIVTYKPKADKHWISLDNQTITDGKVYVAGDKVAAKVDTEIPDNLTKQLDKFEVGDDYSEKQLKSDKSTLKVMNNGVDITSWGKVTDDGSRIYLTITDRTKLAQLKVGAVQLTFQGTLLKDMVNGTKIPNTGWVTLNNATTPTDTPEIEVYTPEPDKHWADNNGSTADSKFFLVGDIAKGVVSVKLPNQSSMSTKLNNIALYDDYTASDAYVTVTDAKVYENGKDVSSEYTFMRTNGIVTATRKDPSKAADSALAQLVVTFSINSNAKGQIVLKNSGGAIINDDQVPTDTPDITTWRSDPSKDVEVGEVAGDTSATINGMTVVKGTVVTFPLSTKSDLPANRETTINAETRVDTLQDGFKYVGYKAYIKQADGTLKDVSSYYQVKQEGQKVSFVGTKALFDYYNANKDSATIRPIIDLYAMVTKDNSKLTNVYTLTTNNDVDDSNEITIKTPKITPTKIVENILGENINGKNVSRGDTQKYELTWDLSGLTNVATTADQLKHGLSFWDDYDQTKMAVSKESLTLTGLDGSNLLKYVDINWDSVAGKWTMTAKNPSDFLKRFGGQKLQISFKGTVLKDATGDIYNSGWQDTFGDVYETNTVVTHVHQIDPKKDVVVNVGSSNVSLDGQKIKLGDEFDYTFAVERDANYGGQTDEWSVIDTLDKRDDVTGEYKIYATYDFVLSDGTVVEKGTDITEYFTFNYNVNTNKVKISAKKSFLDIMNSDANKATKQGWKPFVQAKRVGTGTVTNVFQESYNGEIRNSNKVKTTTETPVTPKTPVVPTPKSETPVTPQTPEPEVNKLTQKPTTPAQPIKPATAAVATPATATPKLVPVSSPKPTAKSLPQTDEDNTAEGVAAIVGFTALDALMAAAFVSSKKRKREV